MANYKKDRYNDKKDKSLMKKLQEITELHGIT